MVRPATHSEKLFQLIAFSFVLGRHDQQKQIQSSCAPHPEALSSLTWKILTPNTQVCVCEAANTYIWYGISSIFPEVKTLVKRNLELASESIQFRDVSCRFRESLWAYALPLYLTEGPGARCPTSSSASVSSSAKGAYPTEL